MSKPAKGRASAGTLLMPDGTAGAEILSLQGLFLPKNTWYFPAAAECSWSTH